MTHSIEKIAYCPTSPCDDIRTPNGCEVTFKTSAHGDVSIRTDSVSTKPRDYEDHIWEAAQALVQRHPEYETAVSKSWKLKPV